MIMDISSLTNAAAWILAKGVRLEAGPSEVIEPGARAILVRNHAWSINPIGWKTQSFGMMLERYPAITGFQIAGDVVAVGDDVERFMVHILEAW